jgi:Na+/proline symporter
MSTCSGALLAPASLLSENIIKPMIKGKLDDPKFLLMTRISVVLIGLLSFMIGLWSQNIFALVSEASVIGLVSIFVPFIATLFFNHTDGYAAVFSMTFGIVTYAFFKIFSLSEINALIPGLLASIFGLGLRSFTKFNIFNNKSTSKDK